MRIRKWQIHFLLLVICSAMLFLYLLGRDSREQVVLLYDLGTTMENSFEEAIRRYSLTWDTRKVIFSESTLESELETLSRKGFRIIIGPRNSSQASVLVPLLERFELFAIAPAVTSPGVLGASNRIISLGVSDDFQVETIVQELIGEEIGSLIIVKDVVNRTYTDYVVEGIVNALSQYVIGVFEIESGFDLEIDDELLHAADAVLFVANPRQTAISLRRIASVKHDIKFFASDYSEGPELSMFGGKEIEALTIYTFVHGENGIRQGDSLHRGVMNAVILADKLLSSDRDLDHVFAEPGTLEFIGFENTVIRFSAEGFAELEMKGVRPNSSH